MKTRRSKKNRNNLLNYLMVIPSKMGEYLRLHGRPYVVLATAISIIVAYTVVLNGCSTTGEPAKYSADQWQKMKYNGPRRGNK